MSASPSALPDCCLYAGQVRHRRLSPKPHHFSYGLHMFAVRVDDAGEHLSARWPLGRHWLAPIRFREKDYLPGDPAPLKQRIEDKVRALGGTRTISNVLMLVQLRCLGLYFSPANFYFCYDEQQNCSDVLVEVSNTPWLEKHYYLVDLLAQAKPETVKDFHVSPFMDLAMKYHWSIKAPKADSDKLLIHIENRRDNDHAQPSEKVFDATLAMSQQPLTAVNLFRLWLSMPLMTLKIVSAIYWQALKLFAKGIPFVPYQKPGQN